MPSSGYPTSKSIIDDGLLNIDGFFLGPSNMDSHPAVKGSYGNFNTAPDQEPRPYHSTLFFPTTARDVAPDLLLPPKQSQPPPPTPMEDYLALGAIRLVRASEGEGESQWLMVGSGQRSSHPHPHPLLSQGEKRQWFQTQLLSHTSCSDRASLRIYAFPEDVNRSTRGSLKDFRKVLKFLSPFIDISLEAWEASYAADSPIRTYLAPSPTQDESLFYIFNTLSSPEPTMDSAGHCPHSQEAMAAIFDDDVPGLKTPLYPYQKRSVAAMLQKEANPANLLDPRKPEFRDLRGRKFYFDVLEGVLLSNPYLYSEPRGGILAETMGYGKTLICIALILATRGHYPQIPEGRLDAFGDRQNRQTPTLLELAAKTLKRAAIPWKGHFACLQQEGYSFDRCIETIDRYDAQYAEPIYQPTMPNRSGKKREEFRTLHLCYATLLIVPPNLLIQWQHEIEKHTDPGALDILTLDLSTKEIPHYRELMKYDVVMITKSRFEQEYRDDDQNLGRRMPGQERFQSQLTEVRWLRVICDEGHGFAGSSYRTNAMAMLDKMSIERRWVVSGTPSHTLHGVEVNLAINDVNQDKDSSRSASIQEALMRRKLKDSTTEEIKDMDRLRIMVVKFLKLQPWANQKGADHADWKKYLAPFDGSGKRRFAPALRVILQSLIVRHRIDDIDTDLCLPPLYNTAVYLEPSYYDKLNMNLFRLRLTSNAVTSERVDEDYMFHPKNRKYLDELINNLRRASFHWVGHTEEAILETLRVTNAYMAENLDKISDDDRQALSEAIRHGERALYDPGWLAFSTLHEIGVYVQGFPDHAAKAWALHGEHSTPLLLGTVQAREAQQHIWKRLDSEHPDPDPTAGLTGAGLRAMQAAKARAAEERKTSSKDTFNKTSGKTATASAGDEPKVKNQSTFSSNPLVPPPSSPTSPSRVQTTTPTTTDTPNTTTQPSTPTTTNYKRRISETSTSTSTTTLPSPSTSALPRSLTQARILGFSSSKLNYLISRILALHTTEKTIIFYDSNNIAFWIAEALELVSVQFLIYANTLSVSRRAAYLATFNRSETFRVLLMDLKQASHGLHVASASRVFIVSPIWQPGVESQAIKRAHRIGQTRPVYVETLVLKGTLEEKILQRRRQMSNAELVRAEKSLLDDGVMSDIIRGEGFLEISDAEEQGYKGAKLNVEGEVPLFQRRAGISESGGKRDGEDDGYDATGDGDGDGDQLIRGLEDQYRRSSKKRNLGPNNDAGDKRNTNARSVAFGGHDLSRSSPSAIPSRPSTPAAGQAEVAGCAAILQNMNGDGMGNLKLNVKPKKSVRILVDGF